MVGLVAVCVALIALALLLDFLTEFVPVLPEQRLDPGLAVLTGVLLLAYPIFAVAYADYALFENLAMPGGEYVAWFSKWAGPAGLTLAGVLLMLLFPDGRLPSRRWRIVAWTALLGAALTALVDALVPGPLGVYRNVENPFGVVGVIGGGFTTYDLFAALYLLGLTLLATSSLAALFSLILRLHRARGDERQQLKWFLYPAVPVIICLSLILLQNMIYDFTTIFLFDTVTLVPWEYFPYLLYVTGFALLVVPVCTYIAILRHHLYDIRRRHKPHAGLRRINGAASGVRGKRGVVAGSVAGVDRAGVTACCRSIHASRRRSLQPLETPYPGVRGSSLLPTQVRRGEDDGTV